MKIGIHLWGPLNIFQFLTKLIRLTVKKTAEEVIGQNSPTNNSEGVIGRNSPTKKIVKRLLVGTVPQKK